MHCLLHIAVDCQAATEQVSSDRLSEIVQSFVTGAILQGQGHYLQQQTEYLSQCHQTATSPSPPSPTPSQHSLPVISLCN